MFVLLLMIVLFENGHFSRASSCISQSEEQTLVVKASYIFQMFDKNEDQLFSKSELEALIALTTDPADLPRENTYRNFCDSVGADLTKGLTIKQLIEAYRIGYGDVEADWMRLSHDKDGSKTSNYELIVVEGAPYYQSLLNGIYVRTKLKSRHPPVFVKRDHHRNSSARYLYWTDEYNGAWLLDDDMDPSSSNGFLSSPGGGMAGTWELANRSKHWIKEKMVSLTCLKEGEEAAVAFDSDGASSNYGLDIKDHLPSHVNEATNKAVPFEMVIGIEVGTNVVIIIRMHKAAFIDDGYDIEASVPIARNLEMIRPDRVLIDTRMTLRAEI
mmetsp:Transcript_22707/g.31692  ORF Transcript_22707/g.31692 Transcript_22707/m.31692 type:complete len:328 (-) Transcript_22707:153-1136(-)